MDTGLITPDGNITDAARTQDNIGMPASVAKARYYAYKATKSSIIESNASVADLSYLCRTLGLPDVGRKEDLAKSLLAYYVSVALII